MARVSTYITDDCLSKHPVGTPTYFFDLVRVTTRVVIITVTCVETDLGLGNYCKRFVITTEIVRFIACVNY